MTIPNLNVEVAGINPISLEISVPQGADGLVFALDKPTLAVFSATDGSSPVLTNAIFNASILRGKNNDTANWTIGTSLVGCTGSLVNNTTYVTFTVATMTSDTATVTFSATREGFATLTVTATLVKVKQLGATATPAASVVPLSDSSSTLSSWIPDASTTKKGKVLLPNASGFAPMPMNAGVMITPATTGLSVGQDGPYRSDEAFTLPAGGTWEYYIEQTASPIVGKGPGIAKTINGSEVIKHIGDNYFVTATNSTGTVYIYRWENGALTQVATYAGPGSTGIVVLQEWDGSTARLALFTGNNTDCTVYVLVFNGTTITLESTNSLPIGLSRPYISGTALTAVRVAVICGTGGDNKNTLYVFDYDTSAKTWAQVGTALSLTVSYRCGMCKVQDSTTDIVIVISPYTLARYTFNGSEWSLVGSTYPLYTNHRMSGYSSFCLPLGNNRWLVGFLGSTSPTSGIVLWWDSTSLVFRPMSPVLKLRASSTSYSSWGYGLSTLLSFDANDSKVYPFFFPAGELTTRFTGVAAGGTTVAPAEIATSYRGRVWRVQ